MVGLCKCWREDGRNEWCNKPGRKRRKVICCGMLKDCTAKKDKKKKGIEIKEQKPMNLFEKLNIIQTDLKAPKGQFNSFGNYHYRSCEDILNAVKGQLKEQKLVLTITDNILLIGDRYYVKATAILKTESGEQVHVEAYARESLLKKGMDEAQITGATSSYARKYALNGLFCIDDVKDPDSQDNTEKKPAAAQPAKPSGQAQPAASKASADSSNKTITDKIMREEIVACLKDLKITLKEVTSFAGSDGKVKYKTNIDELKNAWLSKTYDKVMNLWAKWNNKQNKK